MTAHWPQIVLALIMALSVILHASKHGRQIGTYSGPGKFVGTCVLAWLLYMGGFWS